MAPATRRWWLALLLMCIAQGPVGAADVSSNGFGGGAWSDPATWRGKTVPGPKDDVVIQKQDVVTFDRDHGAGVTCKRLQIDPKGVLLFKTGVGKLVMSVSEGIETYGAIKLDGTRSAKDYHELALVGETADKRKIKVGKGGALLLYGNTRPPPPGYGNVVLSAPQPPDAKEPGLEGMVEGEGSIMIDWQRAYIQDVKLHVLKIDNTGARPNERINVVENRFTGLGRIWLQYCDTPVVARNVVDFPGTKEWETQAGISVTYGPLAEVKDNTVKGKFNFGLVLSYGTDIVATGNIIQGSTIGLNAVGSANFMGKQTVIRGCQAGVRFDSMSGVLEDTLVEGATTPYYQQTASMTVTHFRADKSPKDAVGVFHEGTTLSLLNTTFLPTQFKFGTQPAPKEGPPTVPVTCLQYLVVGVKDAPADCLVEVRTAGLAADAADPNVRNSPAPLIKGRTPLATSLNTLIVKSWTLDAKGKPAPAPEYTVKVLGPAAKEGAARPVLKMLNYRPAENAFRPTLDDATPTLEVSLK